MIFFIAKYITKFFGIDIGKAQRIVFWVLLGLGLLILLFLVLQVRSCFTPSPQYDHKEVIEAHQAIETGDRGKMVDKLAEWDVRQQGIDNSIKAAEEATEKAKRDYSKLSNEQLAAEIERRIHER